MNIDQQNQKLPSYLDFIYGHIYNNPNVCKKEDSGFACNKRTLFQYETLVLALTKEIKMNSNILQLGISFGKQIKETAMTVGSLSQYDIVDICENEIKRASAKYSGEFPKIRFLHEDARSFKANMLYDTVICFMLLSQMPSPSKRKIINNALEHVGKGGEVIFIDWHTPLFYHPLRYLVRMYNRLKHPFVERLWDRDISSYAETSLRSQFSWRKTTYFGRMFQKCVATRKDDPLNTLKTPEIEKEENFFADNYREVVDDGSLTDNL